MMPTNAHVIVTVCVLAAAFFFLFTGGNAAVIRALFALAAAILTAGLG